MADYKTNSQYMEGAWAASRIIPKIESTTYKTLEGAVIAKATLIENFEKEFGFSRDMETLDSNYAWNLGMLDKFQEAYGISEEGSLEDREESRGQEEE
jgi:hypothetical protein